MLAAVAVGEASAPLAVVVVAVRLDTVVVAVADISPDDDDDATDDLSRLEMFRLIFLLKKKRVHRSNTMELRPAKIRCARASRPRALRIKFTSGKSKRKLWSASTIKLIVIGAWIPDGSISRQRW